MLIVFRERKTAIKKMKFISVMVMMVFAIQRTKGRETVYEFLKVLGLSLLSNKPVVLHNGLLDLVFLYQNCYNDLPDKLEVFTSDMFEMFSAGVLDTKYVAEFQLREPASYLGYIFRKW